MHIRDLPLVRNSGQAQESGPETAQREFRELVRALRWQAPLVVVAAILGAICGLGVALDRIDTYTARGTILVENARLFEAAGQELLPMAATADAPLVDTQVELISSEAVAAKVVVDLKMSELAATRPKPWLDLRELVGKVFPLAVESNPAPPSDASGSRMLVVSFLRQLSVKRVKATSVIEVAYTADSPEFAALVVNSVMRTYLDRQSESNAEAVSGASAWIRERMKDIGAHSRIVSEAGVPIQKDGPSRALVVAGFAVLGCLAGLALGMIRASRDSRIRTPADVHSVLSAVHLGAFRRRRWPRFHAGAADAQRISRAIWALGSIHEQNCVVALVPILSARKAVSLGRDIARAAARSGASVCFVNIVEANTSEAEEPHDPKGQPGKPSECTMAVNPEAASEFNLRLGQLQKEYSFVIAVLPPVVLSPGILRSFDRCFGAAVLVLDWNRITKELLRDALKLFDLRPGAALGFVMNDVPVGQTSKITYPVEYYIWRQRAG